MTICNRDIGNDKLSKIIEDYHSPDDSDFAGHVKSHEEYAEQVAVPLLARIAELNASVEFWKKEYNELGFLLDKTQERPTVKENID